MNFDIHTSSVGGLRRLNSVLGFAVLAEAVALCIALSALSSQHERIIIVPPGLSGPVAVDWGRADTEYLKSFGLFYATLIGTITPRNATYVADRLSGMTSPEAYPDIRNKILALAKDPAFQGSGSATNFVTNSVNYEPETGRVFIMGDSQTFTGFGAAKTHPTVYEIEARIIEGRPVVSSLVNYAGSEAHTTAWKAQHPDWNKPQGASAQ